MNRYRVEKVDPPVNGYHYHIQILTSIDGGKTFYYSGIGVYAETMEDAQEVINYYNDLPLWRQPK